jgi:sulfate adenylyltransferase subunit 1
MDSKKLIPGAKYFVQHNTNRVLAKIDSVKNIIATDFSGTEASQLAINEIGEVNIKLSKALYFDAYSDNKSNGAFILMQQQTQRRELAL